MIEIGKKIENFKLPDQNGNIRELDEFKGQKVVIYFYPKDNTSGCTKQACSYRDNYEYFINKGYVVIGISKDSVKSHKNFENKYQLPFILLSDENKEVISYFGVYQEKSMYGKKYMGVVRSTFILDENHVLVDYNLKVNAANDAQDVLKKIGE